MTGPWHGRCLGDRVADLADGRLDAARTERAYAHLASCTRCRVALEAERQARADIATAAPVEPSADLLSRLRSIAVPELTAFPQQPAAGVRPGGGAGVRPGGPACPAGPGATGPGSRRGRRRGRVALASAAGAAALAVAAVMGGGSAALSGPVPSAPSIAPVVDRLTDAHASTADRMPFAGPRVVYAGFSATTPAGSSSTRP